MDPQSRAKISHFRGKPRPGRSISVSYRAMVSGGPGAAPAVDAVTRNIGPGGAFILCSDPLPEGTRIELTLHLIRPRRDIQVTAEVRWRVATSDVPSDVGMGVKFEDLAVDDLLALKEYFASLTGIDAPA